MLKKQKIHVSTLKTHIIRLVPDTRLVSTPTDVIDTQVQLRAKISKLVKMDLSRFGKTPLTS